MPAVRPWIQIIGEYFEIFLTVFDDFIEFLATHRGFKRLFDFPTYKIKDAPITRTLGYDALGQFFGRAT